MACWHDDNAKGKCLECLQEQDEGSTWGQQANDVGTGGKKERRVSSTTAITASSAASASRAVVGARFVITSFIAACDVTESVILSDRYRGVTVRS